MSHQIKPNEPLFRGMIAASANIPDATALIETVTAAVADMKAKHKSEIKKITDEVDRQASAFAALRVGGGAPIRGPGDMAAEAEALAAFGRTGMHFNATLSSDDFSKGGAVTLPVVSSQIQMRQFSQSAVARLARRVTIETGDTFQEPWDLGDPGAAWVGQRESRPETANANFAMLSYPLAEVYCSQAITQRLLDDAAYPLGEWLAGRIADKLGRTAGAAFMAGDGVNKPRGITQYPVSVLADSAREFGTLQAFYTGVSGAFSGSDPSNILIDAIYALRAEFRPGSAWLMNSRTASVVRKFKDAEGRFLWTDSLVPGQPPALLGYPVEIDEYCPDIGANAKAIWFGNFASGYLIIDRPVMRLLRDPFTSKPNVIFYAYQRVGGGLQDSDAMKAIVFGVAP